MSTKKDVFSAKAKEKKISFTIDQIINDVQNSDLCLSENAPIKGLRTEQLVSKNIKAPFMFLGINPSMRAHDFSEKNEKSICFRDEKLGKWINNICRQLSISTNEDIYTTNIVKYPTIENAEPNKQDTLIHFKHFFGKEIFTIKPRLIFACGNFVYDSLNELCKISGDKEIKNISIPIYFSENDIEPFIYYECLIYKTPHPAYYERGGDFDKTKENLLKIKQQIKIIKLDYYFTHLHVHDSYSLKDGVGLPKERVEWALDNDKNCLSTTNHGNISNWMMMYTLCQKSNIKPILGIEAYFNRNAEELRLAVKNDDHESIVKRKTLRRRGNHITLLAKNLNGYYNITACSNDAWVNGYYMYPYMSPKLIESHHEGVICLSGCSGSEINKLFGQKFYFESEKRKDDIVKLINKKSQIMNNIFSQKEKNIEKLLSDDNLDEYDLEYFNLNKKSYYNEQDYIQKLKQNIEKNDNDFIINCNNKVNEIIDWWHNIYGDDYYIEIMVIEYPLQEKLNRELIKIAKEKNIKLVLTHDVHYTDSDGWAVQQLQMLNDQNKTFEDLEKDTEEKIWVIKSKDLYYKDVYELHESWENFHKSEIFTEEIFYEACQNTIEISNKIEKFELDKSNKLPRLYDNGFEILKNMTYDGLVKKGFQNNKEYIDRMNFELDIINKKGFVDYFLVVQEMINWVKTNYSNESVGVGRGSSSGSLVNYFIGITDVDPIKHDLMFARFLDIEREDVVDIDTDYAPAVRDKVIQHLIEKYGQDYVAPVGSLGTTRTKVAIQDSARVLGIPIQETLELTKNVLADVDDDVSWEETIKIYPELQQYIEKNKNYTYNGFDLNFFVGRIKGSIRQFSQHAAGCVVSSENLMEKFPLVRATKHIVTAYQEGGDYRELSDNNYYKIDVLGLNNLQVIVDAMKLIKKRHGVEIDWNAIDLNEKEPYSEICLKGDHLGVFQFESYIAGQVLDMIKPDNFEELSACSAILRPGPLRMGMHEEFAKNKFSKEKIKVPNCIQKILGPTYFVVCYQEQFMQLALEFGLSVGEVNVFRKALVKLQKSADAEAKRLAKVESYHQLFVDGASKPDKIGNKEEAEKWWQLVKNFAAYGFNKAHCISYTYTSYREYWLKYHYDLEFNIALLNNTEKGKEDKGTNVLSSYISQIMNKGYKIISPKINDSDIKFSINHNDEIVWGLSMIKGMSDKVANKIIEERKNGKYKSINDFFIRVQPDKGSLDCLIWTGAFDGISIEQQCDIFGNGYYKCDTRNNIAEFVYKNLRSDKKYEKQIIDEEIYIQKEKEYMELSFIEIQKFVEKRKYIQDKTKIKTTLLSNCSEAGKYTVFGLVESLIKKKTKTGKEYHQFSLKDESGELKSVSIWTWKTNLKGIAKGKTGVFSIEIDKKGFKSMLSYSEI